MENFSRSEKHAGEACRCIKKSYVDEYIEKNVEHSTKERGKSNEGSRPPCHGNGPDLKRAFLEQSDVNETENHSHLKSTITVHTLAPSDS